MRIIRFLALALAVGILLGCQGDDPLLPSEPGEIEAAGQGDCAPEALIAALFPKGLAIAALEQCQNIQRQYVAGEETEAFDQLMELVAFTVEHLANGQLVDPDGSGPLTEESGAAQLIVELHMIVGLADGTEPVPSGALTDDGGTIAMVDAEEGWDITTSDGFAAVTKAAGVPVFLNDAPYTGPVTVFMAPVDPAETSFPEFGLQVGGSDRGAFPLFKEMGTIPDGLRFGDGEIDPENPDPLNELVVELCIVDPPHPLAPFPEQLPDLRVGHIIDGETLEVAPLRSSSLDCDGVNDEVPTALIGNRWHRLANAVFAPVAEILDVAKLYARPGRLGGAISAFSEFGGVDQSKVNAFGDVTVSVTPSAVGVNLARRTTLQAVVTNLDTGDEVILPDAAFRWSTTFSTTAVVSLEGSGPSVTVIGIRPGNNAIVTVEVVNPGDGARVASANSEVDVEKFLFGTWPGTMTGALTRTFHCNLSGEYLDWSAGCLFENDVDPTLVDFSIDSSNLGIQMFGEIACSGSANITVQGNLEGQCVFSSGSVIDIVLTPPDS